MTKPYQLTSNSNIFSVFDKSFIQIDEKNSDYQKYLVWLAAGNTPDSIPELTNAEKNLNTISQITVLENINLMPRPLRDIILKDETNPAYGKVKTLDDQIIALRNTLITE